MSDPLFFLLHLTSAPAAVVEDSSSNSSLLNSSLNNVDDDDGSGCISGSSSSSTSAIDRDAAAPPLHHHQQQQQQQLLLPLPALVPAALLGPVLVVTAVAANALVLAAYCMDPRLRAVVSSLYLLHLAVCDLLLALVSMTFTLMYAVMNWRWTLGKAFCKMYLLNDYTLCTMSVYLLLLISWDTLLILRHGVHYSTTETRTKAYVKIAIAWLLSFLLNGPAILGWERWRGHSVIDPDECNVEFLNDTAYTFITSILEFVLPAVALATLNGMVYTQIRQRTRLHDAGKTRRFSGRKSVNVVGEKNVKESAKAEFPSHGTDLDHLSANPNASMCKPKVDIGKKPAHSQVLDASATESKSYELFLDMNKSTVTTEATTDGQSTRINTRDLTSIFSVHSVTNELTSSSTVFSRDHSHSSNTTSGHSVPKTAPTPKNKVRSDLKAARALFIYTFAFFIFWAPFIISTLIVSFCRDCVNEDALECFSWLLWVKSAMNPFLYAAANPKFKMNFLKILGKLGLGCSNKRKV